MYCTACGSALAEDARFCAQCGAAIALVPGATSIPAGDPPRYAGFWRRVAASIIDGFVLWIPTMVVFLGTLLISGTLLHRGPPRPQDARAMLVAWGSTLILQWLYYAGMHSSRWQATIGKQALDIKVTALDGERISFVRGTARHFATLLSAMTVGIGYLIIAFTKRRQGLHDLVARTLVTSKNATPADVARGIATPKVSLLAMIVGLAIPVLLVVINIVVIAVYAYKDRRVRREVTAELQLASPYRTKVADALRHGAIVADIDNANLGMPEAIEADFVDSIEVRGGMVRIWYGPDAGAFLQDHVLTFTPGFHQDGRLEWICGYAIPPRGVTPVDTEYREYTTVAARYLPASCQ